MLTALDILGDSVMNFSVLSESLPHHASDTDILSEFDFRVLGDGRSASARYANNSNYRNDSLIRKESMLSLHIHSFDGAAS